MAESKQKRGGGKLHRTQTVTLRLDPRLRYLTELAARTQRRTTSGFIEWAIEQSLDQIVVKAGDEYQMTLADEAFDLWDVDEADRFVKLAIFYPNLLTHDEQIIWKLIREHRAFWSGRYSITETQAHMLKSWINFKLVREHWELLKAVAEGEADISALPATNTVRQPSPNDEFSDIPF
jgi:hypothetical protein